MGILSPSERTAFGVLLAPTRAQIHASHRHIALLGTLVVLLITALAVYPRLIIISGSMTPTIPVGKVIVADRASYVAGRPARGDIVVFKPVAEFSDTQWAHRIIGLPGDTVRVWGGLVSVNGQPVAHPQTSDPDFGNIIVPDGYVYEKGDNIDAINGLVPQSSVIGKIVWY